MILCFGLQIAVSQNFDAHPRFHGDRLRRFMRRVKRKSAVYDALNKRGRCDDGDVAERDNEKIAIATHDHVGRTVDREFEKLVVFEIAASRYCFNNFNGFGVGKQFRQALPEGFGGDGADVWTGKNIEQFFLCGVRLEEASVVLKPVNDKIGRRIRLERRTDEHIGINDKLNQGAGCTSSRARSISRSRSSSERPAVNTRRRDSSASFAQPVFRFENNRQKTVVRNTKASNGVGHTCGSGLKRLDFHYRHEYTVT